MNESSARQLRLIFLAMGPVLRVKLGTGKFVDMFFDSAVEAGFLESRATAILAGLKDSEQLLERQLAKILEKFLPKLWESVDHAWVAWFRDATKAVGFGEDVAYRLLEELGFTIGETA